MPHESEISDHFRGGRFFNPGVPEHGFAQMLRWVTRRKPGYWPRFVSSEPAPGPWPRVPGDDVVVTFVNHSTFLIQTGGCNILTDPVWSERASPFQFAGPRRHRDPGMRFDDLPPIDCILISHNHYDHLDVVTLRRLAERDRPTVFCPLGVGALVMRTGLTDVHELDWWQRSSWRELEISCVPAQHFSSRTPFDRNRSLWCGWVVKASRRVVYFAGDTGFGKLFEDIAARFPSLDVALLPIGAYEPEWFMGPIHMTPEQAVEAAQILHASTVIATHFGTFALADDSMTAPTDRLRAALLGRAEKLNYLVLAEGESYRLEETIPVAAKIG